MIDTEYSIELFELYLNDELVCFAATDDTSNVIQLHGNGEAFESEAYHASHWAESHGMRLERTTVSLKRLKEFLAKTK